MITTSQLSKKFITKKGKGGLMSFFRPRETKEFEAVKNLDLEIKEGEFVAFLGPNGAGKTTTLKMLSGILFPSSGTIDVFGYKPFEKKKAFKKSIAFVMAQKTQLFLELPIKDTFDFIAEIYEVDKQQYQAKLQELTERFELTEKLDTVGRRLSLGQRMKAELICSMIYNPRVIFLDEPTIGLDVNSSREVRKFLKESNREYGTTVILTTHNMEDVEQLCDRTVVISKGEKIYDGKTDELKKLFGDRREIEFLLNPDTDNSSSDPRIPGTEVIEHTTTALRLRLDRPRTAEVISQVLSKFTVSEINFVDTDLSEVISKIYSN
jgi:ABC-2 type transport system ATP-binding protein